MTQQPSFFANEEEEVEELEEEINMDIDEGNCKSDFDYQIY